MWFRVFGALVLVLAVAAAGQERCIRDIRLGPDHDHHSLLSSPNTECSYRINAPFGYNIQVSCEESRQLIVDRISQRLPTKSEKRDLNQNLDCDNGGVFISLSEREDLSNATRFYCGVGQVRKEYQSNSLFLHMRASADSRNDNFVCRLSLVQRNCKCRGKNENTAKIVNGKEANPNEFPMMAAISFTVVLDPFCGATIISDHYALTAAHCLHTYEDRKLWLLVGGHDIRRTDHPYNRIYFLDDVIVHPDYNGKAIINDIGLVKSLEKIEFNEAVGPVCLPWKFRESTFAGEIIEAAGWGAFRFQGESSFSLVKVNLDVIDNESCSRRWDKKINSQQMCTYTPKKDTCQGDSGGPLFYTEPESGWLYQVGIVSYGNECATRKPAVNTRVTEYLDWIERQTNNTSYCFK